MVPAIVEGSSASKRKHRSNAVATKICASLAKYPLLIAEGCAIFVGVSSGVVEGSEKSMLLYSEGGCDMRVNS